MKCSICGCEMIGYGNNAQPINDGRCCDDCDMFVTQKRIELATEGNYDRKLDKEVQK